MYLQNTVIYTQKNHYLFIAIYFNLFCTKYILYLCFCFCERKDFITCYNKMFGLKLVIFIRKELLCPVFITPQVCSSFYSMIYSLIKLRFILFLISSFFSDKWDVAISVMKATWPPRINVFAFINTTRKKCE